MAKKFTLMDKATAAVISIIGVAIILAYVTNHVDIIPDILGWKGYLDDAIFAYFVIIFIRKVYKKLSNNADLFAVVTSIPFGEK